jgi:hypothetical protein
MVTPVAWFVVLFLGTRRCDRFTIDPLPVLTWAANSSSVPFRQIALTTRGCCCFTDIGGRVGVCFILMVITVGGCGTCGVKESGFCVSAKFGGEKISHGSKKKRTAETATLGASLR